MRDQTKFNTPIPVGNIPADQHRTYLSVIAEDGGPGIDVTISGGDTFHIEEGKRWSPQPAPMNDIDMVGVGTIIYTGSTYS